MAVLCAVAVSEARMADDFGPSLGASETGVTAAKGSEDAKGAKRPWLKVYETLPPQMLNAVKLTEIAVKLTETPVKLTEIPVKLTEIAVKLTETPVKLTEILVKLTERPAKLTERADKLTEISVKCSDIQRHLSN